MSGKWELRDCDRHFFERELSSFVPERILDPMPISTKCPTELYLASQPETSGGNLDGISTPYRMADPGRSTTGLFFGAGFSDDRFKDSNEFVAKEVSTDKECQGKMVVSPGNKD